MPETLTCNLELQTCDKDNIKRRHEGYNINRGYYIKYPTTNEGVVSMAINLVKKPRIQLTIEVNKGDLKGQTIKLTQENIINICRNQFGMMVGINFRYDGKNYDLSNEMDANGNRIEHFWLVAIEAV